MKYKVLGKTGLKVSVIGFGAWAIGGNMWGPQNDNDSILAINTALDLGVNFIDTALVYGNGHSEEIIGKVLKERKLKREDIYIATKIPPTSWPPPPYSHAKDAFPKAKIISSIEQSLRNLDTDYIDLIQLHSWRENWTNDTDWYETLHELKNRGKVRFIGVSVHDNMEDEALGLIKTGRTDVIQVVYNILAQTPQKNLFPLAIKHNIGIIARVPLAYGALTGKFTEESTFASSDFRKNKYTGEGLNNILNKVQEVKNLVGSNKKSQLVSAALYFALDHEAVSVTIPGMRDAKQAEENCSIFNKEGEISKNTIKKLYELTTQKTY